MDIYLIHWPVHFFYFKNPKPLHVLWAEMEGLVDLGLTKAIGISNFNMLLIMDLLSYARHKPVINQIELNPFINQKELVKFLIDQNIRPVAYCPLARPSGETSSAGEIPQLNENEGLIKIAERH